MVKLCYLCDRKASRADNISLHHFRFPKNLEIRLKWLNACGLTENDDVKRTCICSRHFKADDIYQSKIFGVVKSSIKRNAVPTLYLTNPLSIDKTSKLPPNTPLSEVFDENGVSNQSSSCFSENNIVNQYNVLNTLQKSPKKCFEVDNTECQTSNNSSINFENAKSNPISEDENTVLHEIDSPNQFRKRKFYEPRHVSEISISDFATPKRSKRILSLIKETDKKKSDKIKQLQRQTRNLEKKISSLQDLINHLKENRMVRGYSSVET
ncbi:uncharacterized protein LOC123260167 isoform X3 [Cotesia glomerata]|uniref:uncharacterized protein LOC123260167 isoform X3 n=1 Tax=Cotesia glomerata TaxID=32391 RepID=UPI001D011806|nr:uncharacterized protein LOC123260167 isoform X3 [Cotesia glomerata]